MTFIGIILGIPVGISFVEFVLKLVDLGSISDVNWWSWILAPALTMLFSFLSTLLLKGKITKTDMNESLKSTE